MRSQALEHCVFGSVVLAILLWLDLLPTATLREVMVVLLGWAIFSTVLVATAGAWVAFARARGGRSRPRHRLTHGG